jgi:hypothetical protein
VTTPIHNQPSPHHRAFIPQLEALSTPCDLTEELAPEAIIAQFKTMRSEIKKMTNKVDELEAEFNEHQ